MTRHLLALLLSTAAHAQSPDIRFGTPTPPAKQPNSIRLATYNVENLFDAVDDPALSGQNEDKDALKPDKACRAAAETIRLLDADILALEEIESEAALRWFRDTYLTNLGYDHLASLDAGDERGIEQSVLSRFPIKSTKNFPRQALEGVHPAKAPDAPEGSPLTFHRSPLFVEVEVPPARGANDKPYTLTLVVIHMKSGARSAYWREAEAKGALSLIDRFQKENPAVNIAVLGDFNSQPADASYKSFIASGLTDTLSNRDGTPKFITHESGRTIDYLLVNSNLAPEIIPGSAFVFGRPARPAGVDWRTYPAPDGYASDHYPVSIDITPVDAPASPGSTQVNPVSQ